MHERVTRSSRRRALWLGVSVMAVVAVAGCSSTVPSSQSTAAGQPAVVAVPAQPPTLDPAFLPDISTAAVDRQIFETLTQPASGSSGVAPLLATSWTANANSTAWTFQLRQGVAFQDGTPFNAAAVCANFDRWYNFTGVLQSPALLKFWNYLNGGFANSTTPGLFKSCVANSSSSVTINLNSPFAPFPITMSSEAFAIASPAALTKYKADSVSTTSSTPEFLGTFGTKNPVGTGPYELKSWTQGSQILLTANASYWGGKPKTQLVAFKFISDPTAARQALQAGDINAYINTSPADVSALKSAGFNIITIPPFNVSYLGMNQKMDNLSNLDLRQAIAYALDRKAVVDSQYAPGSTVADQFQPPSIFGYSKSVRQYPYDPAKARQLIAASGIPHPTLDFWYPTGVSQAALPNPSAMFQAFQANLQAVGFTVVAHAAPWTPDYLQAVNQGEAGIYLLDWNADFADPDNFLGSFFGRPLPRFGIDNPTLRAQIAAAEAEPDQAQRTTMYQQINQELMQLLPGVPIAYAPSLAATSPNLTGFNVGPLGVGSLADMTLAGK